MVVPEVKLSDLNVIVNGKREDNIDSKDVEDIKQEKE